MVNSLPFKKKLFTFTHYYTNTYKYSRQLKKYKDKMKTHAHGQHTRTPLHICSQYKANAKD